MKYTGIHVKTKCGLLWKNLSAREESKRYRRLSFTDQSSRLLCEHDPIHFYLNVLSLLILFRQKSKTGEGEPMAGKYPTGRGREKEATGGRTNAGKSSRKAES